MQQSRVKQRDIAAKHHCFILMLAFTVNLFTLLLLSILIVLKLQLYVLHCTIGLYTSECRDYILATCIGRNEVWKYDQKMFLKPNERMTRFFFRGFKYAAAAMVVTIAADKLGLLGSSDHGHGSSHH